MINLSICKLVLILSAVLLLASCDTGYSGDVDPNKEIFNYKYPLKKGNSWEYLCKLENYNFSNDSMASFYNIDTLSYAKLKLVCSNDSALFGGKILHRIDRLRTALSQNIATIDTTTYFKFSSEFVDNISDYHLGYGSISYDSPIDSSLNICDAPSKLLRYNTYIGEEWQINADDDYSKKIILFSEINGERVCLIRGTDIYDQGNIYTSDQYYSKKGLVNSVEKYRALSSYGDYDVKHTIELIKTNIK